MIIKNGELIIDENDIFKDDKLNRKNIVEDLSTLLANTKESSVISIDASWGSGKTTFVKMLQAYLKKEKEVQSIYFNAWKNDFSTEPLVSILGELNSYIEENFQEESEVKSKFETVKDTGSKIAKKALPAFLKGATAGLLDADKGFEEAIGALAEESTKKLIENYSKEKETIEQFKENLEDLLSKIDEEKSFIIFIDELDRCRPLYSIELFERIKHLFGIDRLIFVLSVDKIQLSESIKSQYGNIDANTYLKRFIDLEFTLSNDEQDVEQFCKYLFNKSTKYFYNDRILSINLYLIQALDLKLRDIEQVFIRLNILFKTLVEEEINKRISYISIFFIILKLQKPKLYRDIIAKNISNNEAINSLIKETEYNEKYDFAISYIKAIIYSVSKTEKELKKTIETEENKGNSFYLDIMNERTYRDKYTIIYSIKEALRKVEFLDRFS